jgi:hypothetical protein
VEKALQVVRWVLIKTTEIFSVDGRQVMATSAAGVDDSPAGRRVRIIAINHVGGEQRGLWVAAPK